MIGEKPWNLGAETSMRIAKVGAAITYSHPYNFRHDQRRLVY